MIVLESPADNKRDKELGNAYNPAGNDPERAYAERKKILFAA